MALVALRLDHGVGPMILAPGVYATTFKEGGRRVVGFRIAGRYVVFGWFWSVS